MSSRSEEDKAPKLKGFCSITSSKRIYAADYVEDGIPFVRGKEVVQRFFGSGPLESELFISSTKFETLRDRFGAPTAGDLLLTSVGTLGVPYLVTDGDEFYFKDGNLIWFRNFDGLNSKFFYYWIQSRAGRVQLAKCTIGTSQAAYTIERLKEIEAPKHSSDQQKRIADILSVYDDLIENNRRRIALLEEAARLLYREWFVRFRFPGHEHVKIEDGLPEGWGRSVPSGIIANHIGGGWGKDQPQGKESEPAFVIRGTDIPRVESGDISSVDLRFHGATSLLSRVLVPYDVVFEVSGGSASQPVARTLLLTEERLKLWNSDVVCASFCKRFTFSTAADALYFFFHIREHRDRGDVLVYQKESASSLKNFNFDGFLSSYEFPIPPIPLRKLFFESIDPIVRHQSVLAAQIQQLTQVRDLLLPRLMNGEIKV